ncbi:MAG: hypothetical protein M3P26_11345 [Gemmatimonadota bacterium]|nr:hypothetical protein [Gemmatimonadota bacterium]
MKLNNHRIAVFALAALAVLTLGRTAEAQRSQIHPSFYGSAELDTRHSQFYLLGMYVGMGGLGWSPYFNVNAYSLHYRLTSSDPNSDRTLSAVSPTLGLAYAGRRGGVSFGAGYAWVDNEDPGAPGAEGGGSNGATASFGAYHSGTGRRPLRTQLLSNYNFGSQYLWARGRASVPFNYLSREAARIGAELVGQGGGKDGRKSNSFQAGPTLEYTWTPHFRTTGVVGYKSVGGPSFTSRESAAYLKLEFSFSP